MRLTQSNRARKLLINLFNNNGLEIAASLYGIPTNSLKIYNDYLGCQNIVYDYSINKKKYILRVSYRSDRSSEQIKEEVNFVDYLDKNGAGVSKPILSTRGKLVETINLQGHSFILVSFIKGKGSRIPDNNYRYREGISLDIYYRDWGRTLGKLHALTKQYARA